jgi:hypothetical protein
MIGKLALAMLALMASVSLAFAGDPVGSYDVADANPGSPDSQYSGTVSVQKTGDTYLVIWRSAARRSPEPASPKTTASR